MLERLGPAQVIDERLSERDGRSPELQVRLPGTSRVARAGSRLRAVVRILRLDFGPGARGTSRRDRTTVSTTAPAAARPMHLGHSSPWDERSRPRGYDAAMPPAEH
jgi:hypothetical protein